MGSTAKGLISGFICRLCSKMNRYVILIYGKEGERLGLAEKINLYLPITVTRTDPLPKTVCPNCVDKLEKHSQMIQMITRAGSRFKNHQEMSENSGKDSHTDTEKNGCSCTPNVGIENVTDDEDDYDDSEEDDMNENERHSVSSHNKQGDRGTEELVHYENGNVDENSSDSYSE